MSRFLKTSSSGKKDTYKPEEFSYAPKINPLSEKLAQGENGRGRERWKHLYSDDKDKYVSREEQMRKIKADKEEEEIKECTFRPDMKYTDEFLK